MCQRAAACTPLRTPIAQILPSRSDELVALPVKQAGPQPQKNRFDEKSYPSNDQEQYFPAAKKADVQLRRTMVGTCDARRKRRKIRPAGTISRKGMRFAIQPSKPQIVESGCLRRARRPSSMHDIISRAENFRSFRRRAEQLSIAWEKASKGALSRLG